jgi:hypothetical protein
LSGFYSLRISRGKCKDFFVNNHLKNGESTVRSEKSAIPAWLLKSLFYSPINIIRTFTPVPGEVPP